MLAQLPNLLSALRFLLVPVMWIMALQGETALIGVGLLIGGLSDAVDGALARKLGSVSEFGSKFDSISDQFLQLSAIGWVLILMPEVFSENLVLAVTAVAIYLLSLAVGLIKFKRIANLHLYLSKAGGALLYLFLVHAFLTGQYSPSLFVIAALGFVLSSAETLALQILLPSVDETIGSIFFLRMREDHPVRRLLGKLP